MMGFGGAGGAALSGLQGLGQLGAVQLQGMEQAIAADRYARHGAQYLGGDYSYPKPAGIEKMEIEVKDWLSDWDK